jgi:hypothetical protein
MVVVDRNCCIPHWQDQDAASSFAFLDRTVLDLVVALEAYHHNPVSEMVRHSHTSHCCYLLVELELEPVPVAFEL